MTLASNLTKGMLILQGAAGVVALLLPAWCALPGQGLPQASAQASGWLEGWSDRIELMIDHSRIASTLKDFPVLVHLSSSSGITSADVSEVFSALESDGNRTKIAFTAGDGVTQLYAEIEKWDQSNAQAWIWVRIPEISSTADTPLYLYYDKRQADNSEWVGDTGSTTAARVWDSRFVDVQHLGTPREGRLHLDSTAHRNNGRGGDGSPGKAPAATEAIIGDGQSFDGNDYITIPDTDDLSLTTTGALTFSLWVSPSVFDFKTAEQGYIYFLGKGDAGQYEWCFVFYSKDGTDRPQRISFYIDNPGGGLSSGSYTQKPLSPGDWVYITAKIDGEHTYIYRDGMLAGKDYYVGPQAYVDTHPKNGNQPARLGTRNFTSYFEGRMDEFRVSNVARSDAWIQASYYSDMDSLIFYGSPVSGEPVLRPVGNRYFEAGKPGSFTISGFDILGRPLSYSASNIPPGASFDVTTGSFSWRPTLEQVGTYPGVIFAVSAGGLTDSENVTLIVNMPAVVPSQLNWAVIAYAAAAVLLAVSAGFVIWRIAVGLRRQ